MMIVQLAELASTNVRLKLLAKVIFILLILMNALIVVLVQMFARLKQFTPYKCQTIKKANSSSWLFFIVFESSCELSCRQSKSEENTNPVLDSENQHRFPELFHSIQNDKKSLWQKLRVLPY